MKRLLVVATLCLSFLPGTAQATSQYESRGARTAICHVFGRYCSQALAVAKCESGLSIWARNGQYLGLFQMGTWARSMYGHAYNAWGQARAAYRYFRASGYRWTGWACRP